MKDDAPPPPPLRPSEGPPPGAELQRLLRGYIQTQALYIAVRLGIPELLAEGPVGVDRLAARTGSHAPTLRRALRGLVNLGVLTEPEPGCFALTPLGQGFLGEGAATLRAWTLFTGEVLYPARAGLLRAVESGATPFGELFGADFFEYLAAHPELGRLFDQGMRRETEQVAAQVAAACELGSGGTVVDVGGGQGTLMAALLRDRPGWSGILFDREPVLAAARERLAAAGLEDRCRLVGGDFFVAVPEGGDCYVLSWILHDWDDAQAIRLLSNCRAAMEKGAKGRQAGGELRLLVVEAVLPERVAEPSPLVESDLAMLVLTGGRERTAGEYEALFRAGGFHLRRIVTTGSMRSVLEAEPLPG